MVAVLVKYKDSNPKVVWVDNLLELNKDILILEDVKVLMEKDGSKSLHKHLELQKTLIEDGVIIIDGEEYNISPKKIVEQLTPTIQISYCPKYIPFSNFIVELVYLDKKTFGDPDKVRVARLAKADSVSDYQWVNWDMGTVNGREEVAEELSKTLDEWFKTINNKTN